MEIYTNPMTTSFTSPFGMPTGMTVAATAGSLRVCTTGVSTGAGIERRDVVALQWTGDVVVRDRKAVDAAAAKGHVALVTSIPGTHAWSPPIC